MNWSRLRSRLVDLAGQALDCLPLQFMDADKLDWDDAEEIAEILRNRYTAQDPLKLSFPNLHRMIVELPEFGGDPSASSEGRLETIQMAWYNQTT